MAALVSGAELLANPALPTDWIEGDSAMRRFLIVASLVVLCVGVGSGAGMAAKEKPGVTPAPASLDFGVLPHGEYTTQTVEFSNTTSYTLQRRSAQMAPPFSTYGSSGCSALAPAGKCSIHYAASWLTDSVSPGVYRTTVVQPFVWIDQRGAEHIVTAKVRLTVTLTANQRPSADSQTVTTEVNAPTTITMTGGDPDGDALTFFIAGEQPGHGTLGSIGTPSCSGAPSVCSATVTYTPDEDYVGPDSFYFETDDGVLGSHIFGWVTITVTGAASPAVSASPTEVDFGQRPVGQSYPPKTVTFTNESDSTLWLDAYTLTPSNVGFDDYSSAWMTCYPQAGLAPGASCVGNVSFVAPAVGTHTATLTTEWITEPGGPVVATIETPLKGVGTGS